MQEKVNYKEMQSDPNGKCHDWASSSTDSIQPARSYHESTFWYNSEGWLQAIRVHGESQGRCGNVRSKYISFQNTVQKDGRTFPAHHIQFNKILQI
jgi:hypothetical protein